MKITVSSSWTNPGRLIEYSMTVWNSNWVELELTEHFTTYLAVIWTIGEYG